MDDEYVDRVLSGDTEAFRYFLETYKDMAFNVAVSIVKDDHYAEEIVQDAFMKAFNGLGSFNRTAKFKTWFYRIIVNESFQRIRRLKRDIYVQDISEIPESYFARETELPNEKAEEIVSCIKALSPNESLALNLFYLEEYSLKEIGKITDWTMSKTKVILHRARKNLRSQLERKNRN